VGTTGRERDLTRREFLARAAAGAVVTVGAASGIGISTSTARGEAAGAAGGMRYRTLGRTGLKVSELGLGTIKTENPGVVKRAMDMGVNYFDTAECYQGGNSEVKLGRALKGAREDVVVATKWHTNGSTSAADLLGSLDESLKRLGMEHVDLIQIHGASTVKQVESEELWEAFTRARDAGKVRFNGLSTHGNQVEVVRAAIESNRYDAVLASYNATIGERVGPVMAEAHRAKVGTIAMKVLQPAHQGKESEALQGLRGNPYQQAIQWVLRDANVSTAIVDMPTFEELEEDVAGAGMRPDRAELEEFERAVELASAGSCRLCGACTGQCPRGVRVADIMRYDLYAAGYGDQGRATELYRLLPAGRGAAACGTCSECKVVCPWGVSVRSTLGRAHALLA